MLFDYFSFCIYIAKGLTALNILLKLCMRVLNACSVKINRGPTAGKRGRLAQRQRARSEAGCGPAVKRAMPRQHWISFRYCLQYLQILTCWKYYWYNTFNGGYIPNVGRDIACLLAVIFLAGDPRLGRETWWRNHVTCHTIRCDVHFSLCDTVWRNVSCAILGILLLGLICICSLVSPSGE